MTHSRRTVLQLAAGAAALPVASQLAWAQSYPSQPVRIVVGFAPGSSADRVARLIGHALSERLGQTFSIDHRPGVGGNIAAEVVANAAADGHTLLLVDPSSAINATLYDKLSFDFLRDIAPVAALVHLPNVMLVSPSIPATTVAKFIGFAKANPGTIRMASAGVGTATHLAGELFKMKTGIEMVHVPYRGGAGAYADLADGAVDVYFPPLASALDPIKTGAVRALAVTAPQRSLNLPSVSASVPGYAAGTWYGVGAPRHTPRAIVVTLNAAINASLAEPQLRAQIDALGGTAIAGTTTDFGKLVADETRLWATVIKRAAIS